MNLNINKEKRSINTLYNQQKRIEMSRDIFVLMCYRKKLDYNQIANLNMYNFRLKQCLELLIYRTELIYLYRTETIRSNETVELI